MRQRPLGFVLCFAITLALNTIARAHIDIPEIARTGPLSDAQITEVAQKLGAKQYVVLLTNVHNLVMEGTLEGAGDSEIVAGKKAVLLPEGLFYTKDGCTIIMVNQDGYEAPGTIPAGTLIVTSASQQGSDSTTPGWFNRCTITCHGNYLAFCSEKKCWCIRIDDLPSSSSGSSCQQGQE